MGPVPHCGLHTEGALEEWEWGAVKDTGGGGEGRGAEATPNLED